MNTLTLTADEVGLIVRAVVPAAGTDDMMPVFTYVQVTASDGALWAMATDRYKLCRARLRDFTDDPGEVLIPAAWFKTAAAMLRLHYRLVADAGDLQVTVTWDELTVTFRAVGVPKARGLGTLPIALEFHKDGVRGTFPKLAHLFKLPPVSSVEFATSATTLPPADLLRHFGGAAGGGVFVPPSEGRKTFAIVDPEGKWTWVGMPLRLTRADVSEPAAEAVAS